MTRVLSHHVEPENCGSGSARVPTPQCKVLKAHVCTSIGEEKYALAALQAAGAASEAGRGLWGDTDR